jgi:pseudouridylate synthase
MRVHPDVAAALAERRPVVALESTLLAHGLPRPDNRRVAGEAAAAVRATGAVPATVAVLGGTAWIGLGPAELTRICAGPAVAKLSVRDLPVAVARGLDGATTVASTAVLAARAGIAVLATGGLGGVHRQARESWDESADLVTLADTPIVVVCAGVKSVLDVGATLERLETLSVTVLGYRTTRFPGFYLTDSGFGLDWMVQDPAEVAAVAASRRALGGGAVLVANPLPPGEQLDPALHDRALATGLAGLAREGITGKAVTPYLLEHLHRATGGASLAANIRIVIRNAELAGRIATALAGPPAPAG